MPFATSKRLALAALLMLGISHAALAAGNAATGGDRFDEECAECHSLKPGKNGKGPSLHGVLNRSSGTMADFVYSEPLRNLHWTWTPEHLDSYLKSPRTAVPGGKMKYDGLADAQARADVIAFLSEQR